MSSLVKIKENYEFRRAYTRGESLVTPVAVIYVFKTKRNNVRLGITTGKKIGKAVDYPVIVPCSTTARVQEAHILLIHIMCEWIEKELCNE